MRSPGTAVRGCPVIRPRSASGRGAPPRIGWIASGGRGPTILPGYAPELTPDELVWNYVKRTGTAKNPLASGESLEDRVDAELRAEKQKPGFVRSFFEAPDAAYITD